jgi:hypothetical protein
VNRARAWPDRIGAVMQELWHEAVREWQADPRIRHLCVLAIALLVVLIGVLDLHAATRPPAVRVAARIVPADAPQPRPVGGQMRLQTDHKGGRGDSGGR